MSMHKETISYAVTVCNEAAQLDLLLGFLRPYLGEGDEIVVQADRDNVTEEVRTVAAKHNETITRYEEWALNLDFAQAKNHLNGLCKGEYIFQLDADELPHPWLMEHLREIIGRYPLIELFKFPRINYLLDDATYQSALSQNGQIEAKRVAWPDYQGRLYKNRPGRIRWHRTIHERIRGHLLYWHLPKEDKYALIHIKRKQQDAAKWDEWRKQQK
ncbi:MAG: glycosyltransferase [Paludibacteraceae bacterium]|nr:glycosyltransferase [Paludibacteraceae bacterium]